MATTNGDIRCASIGIEVPTFAYNFTVAAVDSSTVPPLQCLCVNVAAVLLATFDFVGKQFCSCPEMVSLIYFVREFRY